MATPLRVGIIGVGWGSVVQVPAFRMVPEYEVVALCSRRAESVAAAGEKLVVADTSTDWEAFVSRPDLDLISVCTPAGLHAEQVIAAAEAGKHVLCEKPQALTAGDAQRMLDAVEKAGTTQAVCFEGRFESHRLPVWEMVADGYLGRALVAQSHTVADYWHPTRPLQSEWMYRTEDGGGYLMGMSSHDIDFLCCLFGEPESVCADVRTSLTRRERPDGSVLEVDADDTSVLLMRMRSGPLVTISCSAVGLLHNTRQLDLLGTDGTIVSDGRIQGGEPEVRAASVGSADFEKVALSQRMPRSGAELPKRRAAGAIRSLALLLEDWLPAFEGKPAPGVPNLADGLRVQKVIDAARRSSAGEGWVAI